MTKKVFQQINNKFLTFINWWLYLYVYGIENKEN